ncbi:hypothetical protein ACHAXN_013301 [Cyclotella atomus]
MPRRSLTSSAAVAVASFASIISDGSHSSPAVNALVSTHTTAFLPVYQRQRAALHARKVNDAPASRSSSSSASSAVIEQVQPIESASRERRLTALQALTKQRLRNEQSTTNIDDDLLFADMDAASMLLESFTQSTPTEAPAPSKRMNSVPGASSLTLLRQRAAEENARQRAEEKNRVFEFMQSPDEIQRLESLIEHLDEKINASTFDDDDDGQLDSLANEKAKSPLLKADGGVNSPLNGNNRKLKSRTGRTVKSKGRPKKENLAAEKSKMITKVEPLQRTTIERIDRPASKGTKPSRVIGGSLINKRDKQASGTSTTTKMAVSKGSAKLIEPTLGSNAIVNSQRRRVVKQLPKSRRDEDGNLEDQNTVQVIPGDSKGTLSDALNLNLYYRTELLTAREEYSLGMKVKFMVKCEAVHEGLSNALGRTPTIAEWAAACGFHEYDSVMSSDRYIETELDREIRPTSVSSNDELAPNMFVGNGLVTDSGVGRGKGRVKKPPPNSLGKFYDDSYAKFKRRKKDDSQNGVEEEEELDDDEFDIFLHRQKCFPGEPINQGTPREFREMMLTAKEAKQRMVQCNMRLVVSIARRYHGVGVSVPDLIQEGSLGLSRAAEKFDPKRGFKFSTYASWWIQQAVFRSIAYHSRTIRLPVHVHNLLNKVRRARQILQQELGRMPSNEEVAAEMDMSVEKYNKMIRSTRHAISLERPKYKNNPKDLGHESEALVGDMVDSAAVVFDEKTPEQQVDHGLLHNDIDFMLGKLGDDERAVLCLRYGIKDGITRTVTLVASELRQTKSWVRSQECRALRKLRRPWYERRLKEHKESLQATIAPPL